MRPVRVFLVVIVVLAAMLSWASYAVAEHGTTRNERQTQDARPQATKGTPYTSFHKIADDSDTMSLEVPTEWSEVETGPWVYQGKEVGVFLAAAPALDDFYTQRKTPGVFIAASHELTHSTDVAALLGLEQRKLSGKCKFKERKNYTDPFYSGLSDAYVACGDGQHDMLVLAVTPPNRNVLILIQIKRASDADTAAIARIFETFEVLGVLGHDDHDH